MKLLGTDFCSWNFLCADFCSWNLLHLVFSLRETYINISACETDFAHGTCCVWILFMELVGGLFLFVKLVACWFFFFVKVLINFSPRETDFVHWTFCVVIFICTTCCVLIFVRETCWMRIFLFMKLVHWVFSPWNRCCSKNLSRADFYSWNFLRADFCMWNLLHVYFSIRTTCILIFILVKISSFM